MDKLVNQEGIENIIKTIMEIQPLLNKTKEELNDYLQYLREGNYVINKSGTFDQQMKQYESLIDRLEEIVRKRTQINSIGEELRKTIGRMSTSVEQMFEFVGKRGEINVIHDEMIKQMIELEKQRSQVRITELENQLIIKVKTEDVERLKGLLEYEEIQQLQGWTQRTVGEIVFDTEKDDWDVGTTQINQKLINRSELMFLVEDTEQNKFGFYLSTKIQPNIFDNWVATDSNSFLFSLKSNGRIDRMMQFELINKGYGYYIYMDQNKPVLFYAGVDFYIGKKSRQDWTKTMQNPQNTNLNGIEYPLTGRNGRFSVKQFVVIQMN